MWKIKRAIALATITFATVVGIIGLPEQNTKSVAAANKYKTVTTFKHIKAAPISLRGNWYTYTGNGKKHTLKSLLIGKNYLSAPTRLNKKGAKYVTKHYTFVKNDSLGHATLAKTDLGWYYYALNGTSSKYSVKGNYWGYGIIKPGKIGNQKVLYWYLYNSGATYMKVFTHNKNYNSHQKYTKSTKGTTVLAFPSK